MTVIQLTELVAVHVQFVPVMTESELVLPTDETETVVGVTVDVHCASAGRDADDEDQRNQQAAGSQRRRDPNLESVRNGQVSEEHAGDRAYLRPRCNLLIRNHLQAL